MSHLTDIAKQFRDEGLRSILYTSDLPLRERLFILAGVVGSMGILGVAFLTTAAGQGTVVSVSLFATFVVFVLCVVMAVRTKNFTLYGSIVVLAALAVFPFGYILGGGADSGTPIWFIIIILFIAAIFPGKLFWIYGAMFVIEFAALSYYTAIHPEIVTPLADPSLVNVDTFFSATVVAALVAILMRYQNEIFNRENKLAREQKEEIQELSNAQSRFFSSMSHEIRTPLNTIIGLNEMTLRDQQISQEIAENATNIQNASRMLLSLINDILDLSKIESGRMELAEAQYETSRMLSDVVNLLWSRAKDKNLRFEVNVGEDVPSMLYGDEMRLKQVIINVLTNAIKYTEEGGVTLTVDGEARNANEFLLRIDVDDTGIGIRKEAIPYLFDSFKRIDVERNKNVEGTGLGLAISKQLIDLMGGTITVDSIFTKGSHFRIEVVQKIVDANPVQYTSLSEHSATATYETVFEAPDAHVLIVDDNDMNRMVSRKLLRGTRVQADVAASGQECLEKTAATSYDVIFMDHEMPEMDGIETLQALRNQAGGLCKNTPVIALTANAGSDMNAFYINHGFQAYLAKPIHGSLLEATLLQFLPSELIERTSEVQEGESIRVGASRHKRAIAITVDSPCGLPEYLLEDNDIARMPFYITTNTGRFRDAEELDANNLFSYIEAGGVADSAPATVEEYEAFFGEILTDAETVLHLSVGSQISPGYTVALAAAESFDNVHVMDTRHMSSSLGLLVLHASELVKSDFSIEEILADLDAYANAIVATLLVPSIDSPIIQKGMPMVLRGLIKAFSWEPVLRLRNGRLRLSTFHGGYVISAADKYIKSAMRRAQRSAKKDLLFITYSGCSVEEQEEILKLVETYADFDQVIMEKASATVAAKTWLHAFGFAYVKK